MADTTPMLVALLGGVDYYALAVAFYGVDRFQEMLEEQRERERFMCLRAQTANDRIDDVAGQIKEQSDG